MPLKRMMPSSVTFVVVSRTPWKKLKRNRRNLDPNQNPIGVLSMKSWFLIPTIVPRDEIRTKETATKRLVALLLVDPRLATKAPFIQQTAVKYPCFAVQIQVATCVKWRTQPREYMGTLPIDHARLASPKKTMPVRKPSWALGSHTPLIARFHQRVRCVRHDPCAGEGTPPQRRAKNLKLFKVVCYLLLSTTAFYQVDLIGLVGSILPHVRNLLPPCQETEVGSVKCYMVARLP